MELNALADAIANLRSLGWTVTPPQKTTKQRRNTSSTGSTVTAANKKRSIGAKRMWARRRSAQK